MKAYKLLALLTHLTLVGYENGEYEWVGTDSQWQKVDNQIANFKLSK